MKSSFVGAAVALSLVLTPLAHAETPSVASVKKAIEAVNAKLSEALAKGDAKAVTALYTADAYVMPPNLPAVHGSAAVEALWDGFIKQGAKGVALATEDVDRSGDLAAETGTFTFTMQPEGKPAVTTAGKYVVVWKRQKDGGWKLHRDIWNANGDMK